MWTLVFWQATAERVISTAAQTALSLVGADAFDVVSLNWRQVCGVAAGAALVSLLKCLVASKVSGDAGPSLVSAEKLDPIPEG